MSQYIEYRGEILRAKDFLDAVGLSVHALIHPNGNVEAMKRTDERALHAGVSEWNDLDNLNDYFLGYELLVEGNNNYSEFIDKIENGNPYTKEQYDAAVMLTKVWMEVYDIPYQAVVRHSDVSGDHVRGEGKGKKDPGKAFDWKHFKEEIV